MNNKQLGTEFEKQMLNLISKKGYWAHFITPDKRGAQPFDIIAVKDCMAIAIDCKTSKDHIFRLSRLEDNQIMAFEKWMACGNSSPWLAIKYNDEIYMVEYEILKKKGSVDLNERT